MSYLALEPDTFGKLYLPIFMEKTKKEIVDLSEVCREVIRIAGSSLPKLSGY